MTTGSSPWPREAGPLLLRAPRVGDAEQVLRFRNDAGVNRFMVHTHVDPDDLRRDLVEAVTSPTDHSCARGLLDAAFDLGVRRVVAACVAPASVRILEGLGMMRERHGVRALWHAELGWVDEYEYAMLASERPVTRGRPLS